MTALLLSLGAIALLAIMAVGVWLLAGALMWIGDCMEAERRGEI